MPRYLLLALICGWLPVGGSLVVWLMWVTMHTPWAELLAWLVLLGTIFVFPVGVTALILHVATPDPEGERTPAALVAQTVVAGALLLAGIPLTLYVAKQVKPPDADVSRAHTLTAPGEHPCTAASS